MFTFTLRQTNCETSIGQAGEGDNLLRLVEGLEHQWSTMVNKSTGTEPQGSLRTMINKWLPYVAIIHVNLLESSLQRSITAMWW